MRSENTGTPTGKVQTVLGAIEPAELGVPSSHEHMPSDMSACHLEPDRPSDKNRAGEPLSLENLAWARAYRFSNLDTMRANDPELATEEVRRFKRVKPAMIGVIGPRKAGQRSAGNGALMRIPPRCASLAQGASDSPWREVLLATVITHRDEAAVAGSVGFVGFLCECLGNGASEINDASWWPATFLR